MYKKGSYIVARVLGFLAFLFLACLLAVQTPYVQTKLTTAALEKIVSKLDSHISYDELQVMPSGVLRISNLAIVDDNPNTEDPYGKGYAPDDTLFRAKSITATFSIAGVFRKEGIHMGRATVEDGYFHLISEPNEYLTNLGRMFNIKPSGKKTEPGRNIFDISKVRIRNIRVRITNMSSKPLTLKSGINFEDMDIMVYDLRGHAMRFAGGKMYGVADRLKAREKSGFNLQSMTGRCEVGLGKTLIEDLHIVDDYSDVRLATYTMNYESTSSFSRYISDVKMEARFRRTSLALKTISFFAGGTFEDSKTDLDIKKGHFIGFVDDFKVDGLEFHDRTSGVYGTIDDYSMIGLPDIYNTIISGKLRGVGMTPQRLAVFLSGLSPTKISFGDVAKDQNLRVDASFSGPMNRLAVNATIGSGIGGVKLTGDVRNVLSTRAIEISVTADTDRLDLGAISGSDALGEATLHTKAMAILHPGNPAVRLDTLHVDRINLLGYEYRNIDASGSLENSTVDGSIKIDDKNLQLNLAGLADLKPSGGYTRLKLAGELPLANLHALKLDNRGSVSRVKLGLFANIVDDGKILRGDAFINGIQLTNDEGIHEIGDIVVRAHPTGDDQSFRLTSSFMDAVLVGNKSLLGFINDLQDLTTRKHLSALFTKERKERDEGDTPGHYDLEVNFHDSRPLMSFVMPGLYIADKTKILMAINAKGVLTGSIVSDRIAANTTFLKDIELRMDNLDNSLNAVLTASELTSGKVMLAGPALSLYASDNDVAMGMQYDNLSSAGGVGEIYVDGQLYRDQDGKLVVKAHPLDSYITAGNSTWIFDESDIVLSGKDLFVNGFSIRNGEQSISIDGGITSSRSDTLSLSINKLNLAIVDEILQEKKGIEGTFAGKAYITSAEGSSSKGMLMNFKADSLRIGGHDAGTITLSSMWNNEGHELGIYLLDRLAGRDALYANGSYDINEKKLNLTASLDQLPVELAQPFLSSVFSDMGGGISGRIIADGALSEIGLRSEGLFLSDAMVQLAYTGVSYTARGPLHIDESGCHFDQVEIRDNSAGTGTLNGALRFNKFKDFALDATLSINNMKAIDHDKEVSGGILGLLRASGNATINGPLQALSIEANLMTSGPGEIRIPSSGKSSTTASNLLTFTQPMKMVDPYEEMMQSMKTVRKSNSDLRLRANVNVQPDVKGIVEIDSSTGNMANFNGSGNISAYIRPSRGTINLNGTYTINEGLYQFVLPGVLAKDFTVVDGSTIKFGGDIMETDLDVNVKYSLKTSLSPLLGNSDNVDSRRLVECGLTIGNKIKSPELTFAIDVPNLDPTTRSMVESAINTSDKIQKQFVALLLMGSFLPSESSGVFNGSNVLYSSVTSLMANQINTIFQRLEIPLDIGLGYQTGNSGKSMFDLAISTKLFDNRVIVGGSVGNRQYKTSGANSDVVGDLDIQVLLDNAGQFRFNIFSHSADDFTNFLDNSQRNGVGLSYQKEYTKLGDFFRNLFKSKKKRDQQIIEALQKKADVTIKIEKDEDE